MRFKTVREILNLPEKTLRRLSNILIRNSFPSRSALSFPFPLSSFELNINKFGSTIKQDRSRLKNIERGSKLIDGIIVFPKQVFSLKDFFGDPDRSDQFEFGPMIQQGQKSISKGGGLCLISSLLFNLVLLSGLKIIEKHNHSIDLWGKARFAPLGRDATYAYLIKDFKFQNDSNSPVRLELKIDLKHRKLSGMIKSTIPKTEGLKVRTKILQILSSPDPNKRNAGAIVETIRTCKKTTTYYKKEIYLPH